MTRAKDGVRTVTGADISLPRRPREAHKGNFGKVCILGGSVGYSGAPVLAAAAAVRTGSGLVTVLVPEPVWSVAAVKLTSAMPWPLPAGREGALSREAFSPAMEKLERADAALIGPGLSRNGETAQVIRTLIPQIEAPLVLDADGINALEGHIDVLDSRKGLTVLTPHDGEFARMGGDLSSGDRVEAARAFAAAHHCVLVLKGHRTVTAFPGGEVFINTSGNPGMAKGGSGDVLAGMLLSMVGQGFPVRQAVPWGVYLHGAAGDVCAGCLGEYGMSPGDMVETIPTVLKQFEKEDPPCARSCAH